MEKITVYFDNGDSQIVELPHEDMSHMEIVDFIDELMGGNDNWNSYDTEQSALITKAEKLN